MRSVPTPSLNLVDPAVPFVTASKRPQAQGWVSAVQEMAWRTKLGGLYAAGFAFAAIIDNHAQLSSNHVCSLNSGPTLRTTSSTAQSPLSWQPDVPSPPLEVVPLIISGPSNNRVDLVFFSDGYLASEKTKFISDAKRLAEDVSRNQTFNTVQPLLNFWAAFTPSRESGIGVGGHPKDTVYGLFRDGTELRGVYYEKPEVARAACDSLGDRCDYPILLGNDPFYGGLGGDFTVITSSTLNGPLVLRHELGHSIIEVGEEYDGGFAYFGVNSAHHPTSPTAWDHWLEPGPLRVERSVMVMQQYPWTLLEADKPWKVTFLSSGQYSRHVVRFSLSGLPESTDLAIMLDGVTLEWQPKEGLGVDRWHYDIDIPTALSEGEHVLSFSLQNPELQGIAQLCSTEILEFGNEDEYDESPGRYSLYPTFSEKNETTYRPTHNDCLMRTVTQPNFCKVCLEGLWLHLLQKVSFIDNIAEGCTTRPRNPGPDDPYTWVKTVDLTLIPLAHLRKGFLPSSLDERYIVTWKRKGKTIPTSNNAAKIELTDWKVGDTLTVKVEFRTKEVRINSKVMTSAFRYTIKETCG